MTDPNHPKIPAWVPDPDSWGLEERNRAAEIRDNPGDEDPEKVDLVSDAIDYFDWKSQLPEGESPSADYHTLRYGVPRGWKPPVPKVGREGMLDTISARPEMSSGEAAWQGFTNAFNFGDEEQGFGAWLADTDAGAAIASGLGLRPSAEEDPNMPGRQFGRGMNAELDPRSSYEVFRDRKRAQQEQAAREHPLEYYGSQAGIETLASLPLLALPGGAAASAGRASTMLQRGKQAAKAGALTGFISGAGHSTAELDEDPLAVAEDAAWGAGIGAVTAPIVGEAFHRGLKVIPKAATATRNLMVRREADRIRAAHGDEAAERALAAANPASEPGREIRANVLGAELPEVKQAQTARVERALTEMGPGQRTRAQAARAADPDVRDEYTRTLESQLKQIGPKVEQLELARKGKDPALIDRHTREVTDALTSARAARDKIEAKSTIHEKMLKARDYMARDQADPQTVIESADTLAREARGKVEEMFANTEKGTEEHRLLGRILPYLREYDHPIAVNDPTPHDLAASKYARLDQVKRDLQKNLKHVKFKAPETEALNRIESGLRENLERPDLWGEGTAAMQVSHNRAYHRLLQMEQARDGRGMFYTDVRGIPSAAEDNYRALPEGDEGEVKRALEGAADIEREKEYWFLREHPQREAELGDALTRHPVRQNPELQALARQQAQDAATVRRVTDERLAQARAAQAYDRLPPYVQRPGEGAESLIARAGDPVQDEQGRIFERYLADQGPAAEGPRATIRNTLARARSEGEAARELARYPQPIQDPAAAAPQMVARAGTGEHDPNSALLQEFVAGEGPDAGLAARGPLADIDQALRERARQVEAKTALDRGETNLPDPPALERGLARILNMGSNVPGMKGAAGEAANLLRPQGRPLSQQAMIIAQLERQLDLNPQNEAARKALDRMLIEIPDATGLRGGLESLSTLATGTSAGDLRQSRGHKLEGAVRRALQGDPASLGPYGQALTQAVKNGSLGQALFKLEGDPQWAQYKNSLNGAR